MKLWQKNNILKKEVEEFTVGSDYLVDRKLVKYDCIASISHAKMLHQIGILSTTELKMLENELNDIIKLSEKKKFLIKKEEEDCHTAIENHLVKKLGDVGKKIHTARSRNDQVATALRLYYKYELKESLTQIDLFIESLNDFKKKYAQVKIPGYTHMRKAMPSSIDMWISAFIESMQDNKKFLKFSFNMINQNPLGSGAGYGVPIYLKREFTTNDLGFEKIQKNPLYVQNSRGKFESIIVDSLSNIMLDLNKMASDILLFSMQEFGYFELNDNICTGSSIMPHKKNPDVLELVRANYHHIISLDFQIKQTIGNLISGYNRDVQLTKKAVMTSFEISKKCLNIMTIVFDNLKINKEKCLQAITDEMLSVDEVFNLVKKGLPFREAYKDISKKY